MPSTTHTLGMQKHSKPYSYRDAKQTSIKTTVCLPKELHEEWSKLVPRPTLASIVRIALEELLGGIQDAVQDAVQEGSVSSSRERRVIYDDGEHRVEEVDE